MRFEEAIAFALTLPDTQLGTSYGKPDVKLISNGRAFLFPSHEADTSFGVAVDFGTIELLKETDPSTFWQPNDFYGHIHDELWAQLVEVVKLSNEVSTTTGPAAGSTYRWRTWRGSATASAT